MTGFIIIDRWLHGMSVLFVLAIAFAASAVVSGILAALFFLVIAVVIDPETSRNVENQYFTLGVVLGTVMLTPYLISKASSGLADLMRNAPDSIKP